MTAATGIWAPDGPNLIVHGDNLAATAELPDAAFRLVYLDPPFNTGRAQARQSIRTVRSPNGDRVGFQGATYETVKLALSSYDDRFADYWAFLEPRLAEAWRLLDDRGTLYLHLDYREVHYAKVALDALFGRDCFLNEIVWAYDYGGRPKDRWPAKHDNILWYAVDPDRYVFRRDDVDRVPYMAPRLVTPEKAARGKVPTDVWWQTIVPTSSRERTGYPTQKPLKLLERIVRVHSDPGDLVVDFFAGSGTTGEAAARHGRRALLVDCNPEALRVMERRLGPYGARFVGWPGDG